MTIKSIRSSVWRFFTSYPRSSLFGLALFLRLPGLWSESLWYDEIFSATLARLPIRSLILATAGDVHPPLWYLIEYVIVRTLGSSEAALRFPALIFGCLSIVELYNLVKLIAGKRIALTAGLLSCFMPGLIYYSNEARMYSLFVLLVLMATRAILDQNRLRLFAASALILWLQNLGAFYVLVLGLLALWRMRSRAILPMFSAGLCYLPWIPAIVSQLGNVSDGFWLTGKGIGGAFYMLVFGTLYYRIPDVWMLPAITAVAAVTIITTFSLRRVWRSWLPLLALAFAPPLLMWAVSSLWRPILLPRAGLPSAAALVAIWAGGLHTLQRTDRRIALALISTLLIGSLTSYWLDPSYRRFPLRDYVQPVIDGWQAGDAIYSMNTGNAIISGYYLSSYPSFVYPLAGDLTNALTRETKDQLGITQHERTIQDLIASGYKRVWVFDGRGFVVSHTELQGIAELVTTYPTIQRWELFKTPPYGTIDLYLVDLQYRQK